jgi:HD-GYP domain-containing protein (c-di-GMP phosphodiesterase class II)
MKEISIFSLRANPPQTGPIFHFSGQVLLGSFEELTPQVIMILEREFLPSIILPDAGETQEQVRSQLLFSVLNTHELELGVVLPSALYDRQDRLLLEAGSPITSMFCESLSQRGIQEILVRKVIPDSAREEALRIRKAIRESLETPSLTPSMGFKESRSIIEKVVMPLASADDFSPQKLQARINKLKEVAYKISGEPFEGMIRDTRVERPSEDEKTHLSGLTQDCLQMTQEIYTWFSNVQIYQSTSTGPLGTINRLASTLMAGVIQHKDIMGLCTINAQSPEYLPAHSLAVAVVSCLTGIRMHLGLAQIKSLIYGALLADIGLLRTPKIIMHKRTALDEYERAQIKRHPATSLEMLSLVRDLPSEVPWIVFQSHERCDGSGYPSGKKSPMIHMLAKIVSLADTYVAMCTPRPHRPAFLPYKVMEALLQMAARQEFDPDIVKVFLEAQSLFPVGSLVQLNDGRIAQVVSTNPDACSRPVIIMISDVGGRLLADPGDRISLMEHPAILIVRPLANPAGMQVKNQLAGF